MSRTIIARFGTKTGIMLIILGSVYGLFMLGYGKYKDNDSQLITPVATSKSNLQQHYIALQNLQLLEGSDPAIAYRIDEVRGFINQTKEPLLESKDPIIQDLIKQEEVYLQDFDASYSGLRKLLLYLPLDDLGTLNASQSQQELQARIQNANSALSNITQNNGDLSNNTKAAIDQSRFCLSELQKKLEANQYEQYTLDLRTCNSTYNQLREQAFSDLTQIINDPKYSTLFESFESHINDL